MLDPTRDLLVTTSLLGAVEWFLKSPNSLVKGTNKTWKQQSYESLVDNLKRVFNPTEEIKRGMAFEKQVNGALCLDTEEEFMAFFKKDGHCDDIREFYREGKGALQQKVLKKFVTINGQSFCLYGKADLYFPTKSIKDIKTSHSWKGRNSYLSTTQHLMYCYLSGIELFRYIVAIFAEETEEEKAFLGSSKEYRGRVVQVEKVDFHADPTLIENQILDRIKQCMLIIENDPDLKKLYLTSFCLY